MAAVESTYALTSVQKGMLFHHLSAPNAGVDIEQIVGKLREEIDIVAFRRAWERVVSRHGAFRTVLRWEDVEEPLQNVHDQVTLPLHVEDWRDGPATEQETRLTEYLRADRLRGFHLTRPPLVRLALFRVGDAEHRLVWTFHHILMDGRSFSLVLSDVFAFYDALRSSGEQEREPARSFGEHIRWLSERDRTHDEAFWRPRLEGST